MKSPLATPITLPCGQTIPNRLIKAAMTEGLADPQNRATEAHATLYRRWAEGGAGVLITGNVQIDENYLERPGNVVIQGKQSEDQLARLRDWAGSVTETGMHIWMQISHAGRQTPAAVTKEPVAPSEVPVKLPGGQYGTPRALTAKEVEGLPSRYAAAAAVAKETGFSGVQIHGAHGYLLSEFLSPLVNRREDKWGGSLENRARLLLDVVREARAMVGPEFPISVKLNSTDFQKGGFGFDDCLKVVEWLSDAGIDCLEISGGSYEQPKMMGSDGLEPAFEEGEQESTRQREAYFMKYAAEIKRVAKMPLMVTGGFRTRAAMIEAVENEGIAFIGLARPLCVDTDAPQQLLSGRVDTLSSWENVLRLGPGLFGPNSPIKLFKVLNIIGVQSWCCMQLLAMGRGEDPNRNLGLFKALRQYQANEAKAAKALIRTS